ncbi:DMT family transporter [Nocardioides anomalus]|uniref:DMT family transporter n=1 Tax=Nocardioides anomalus TaxID=2712223 RepID=A0A6G6WA75_9ACTN|nr:DMT family transporter [Nocardioides anomalus]QIG42005.1 DMT family transporter [Nocardioides anomalus]
MAVPFTALCLLWGTTPIVIKAGLDAGWPPLWFCALRLLVAATLLAPVLLTAYAGAPLGAAGWRVVWPIGVFGMALNFGVTVWGQQFIGAALASLVVATQPITTTVIAHVVRREAPTPRFVAGLLAGAAGTVIVFRGAGVPGTRELVGALAVFAGVTVYGGCFVWINARAGGLDVLRVVAGQNLIGGVLVAAAALLLEGAPRVPERADSWVLFAYLAVLSSIVAVVLANRLIARLGAARFSVLSFITPIVGVVASVLLLGERLDHTTVVGAVVIGLALLLTLGPRVAGGVSGGPSPGRARWRWPSRRAAAGSARAAARR